EVLVWWMHTRLDTSDFPGHRHVLHVRFTDDPERFWIVIESGEPSICLVDPGFEVHVTITAELAALYEVWLGRLPLDTALRAGTVAFDGPRALVRRMPTVLQLSPLSPIVISAR
ncbi:MAG TPA: SCP2 sterol-binding domain-containing protein, partial [Acidimicrobiales bacterium]|nr:SCP2 sterol-binding domain-containing protein [Acidimicrobiales bacterium]